MTIDEFIELVPWRYMRVRESVISDAKGNCPILSVACPTANGKHNNRAQSIAERELGLSHNHANAIIAAADNACLGIVQIQLRERMLTCIPRTSLRDRETRQTKRELRQRTGLCIQCGRPRSGRSSRWCDPHLEAQCEFARRHKSKKRASKALADGNQLSEAVASSINRGSAAQKS